VHVAQVTSRHSVAFSGTGKIPLFAERQKAASLVHLHNDPRASANPMSGTAQ